MKKSAKKTAAMEVEGVGTVLFERSSRARHVNISVRPFTGIRVAVPRGVSFEQASELVRPKRKWMTRHLAKMRTEEAEFAAGMPEAPGPARAKELLASRIEALSEEHCLPFGRVTFRAQRTLWGSCSAKNNISLNLRLAGLPEELVDYVIVHELVHTVVKNHSGAFWRALEGYVPGARALDKRLKRYRLLLG